ncbi:MAG: NifB/NifX family molybdenum-iron cluster-binding protein [Hydrogenobaculum sp.]|jgi:predicted Fe-Mo cluster-binding NifX family protein
MKTLKTVERFTLPEGFESYENHVAIPIKAPKENSPIKISPLFGEVKFFAFHDKNSKTTKTLRNPVERGGMVIRFLLSLGVRELIFLRMGQGAYNLAISNGMKVYFAEDDKISFDELLRKYESNELILVTPDKFELLTR